MRNVGVTLRMIALHRGNIPLYIARDVPINPNRDHKPMTPAEAQKRLDLLQELELAMISDIGIEYPLKRFGYRVFKYPDRWLIQLTAPELGLREDDIHLLKWELQAMYRHQPERYKELTYFNISQVPKSRTKALDIYTLEVRFKNAHY